MSFLIDPPLLFLNGEAYARLAPEEAQRGGVAKAAAAATIGVFWTVGAGLYVKLRDFMVNSGVLRIDTRRGGARMHLVAALIFATYPLWLLAGWRHGRRSRA